MVDGHGDRKRLVAVTGSANRGGNMQASVGL
jgi:hypothetical protein